MKRLTFVLFSIVAGLTSYGQNEPIYEHNSKSYAAAEGTFQIIPKGKILELVTEETRERIESMRKDDEDVYWNMNDMSTVFIPSRNKITSQSFDSLSLYAG
jgi:hypothetical protein